MQNSIEEITLLKKLQQGDESVIERLVKLFEPVIMNVAKQFANRGLTMDELCEIGKQALIKCAKTEIGNTGRERFFRFGGWWIRQSMLQKINEYKFIMSYNTEKFDDDFLKWPIYNRYPEMKPFVGKEYGKKENKLLVIGESFYLPRECEIHQNADKWYKSDIINEKGLKEIDFKRKVDKEDDYEFWIDTVFAISTGKNRKYDDKSRSIFVNIENAIIESGFHPEGCENLFQYIAYYNYFQRPAEEKGDSLNITDLDRQWAKDTLLYNLEILKPTHVLFASTKAWDCFLLSKIAQWDNEQDCFLNDEEIVFDFVPHPASAWWNKVSKKYEFYDGDKNTGKMKMIKFLKHYKIFE